MRQSNIFGSIALFACLALVSTWANAAAPTITNSSPSGITAGSAVMNGDLTSTGGVATFVFLYWGPTDGRDTNSSWANTNNFGQRGQGALSNSASGLASNTTYYYRYYATNVDGEAWATPSESFTTKSAPEISNLGGAANVTHDSGDLQGDLSLTGGLPTQVWVFWGLMDGGGTNSNWMWTNALGQRGEGALVENVTGLGSNITYYYRYYASNGLGAAWASPTENFTTKAPPAISNLGGATNVTTDSADLQGSLSFTGDLPTDVWVYWGPVDAQDTNGNWASSTNLGQLGEGDILTPVSGLASNTTYYYRYYASNASGSDWGAPSENFTTRGPPVISNAGAASITYESADLLADLSSVGGYGTAVWVFWGRTNGQAVATNWGNSSYLGESGEGSVSTNVSGLVSNATYYYTFFATNAAGETWAVPVEVFITGEIIMEATDPDAAEAGADPGEFTFYRPSGCTNADLTVDYSISGTADNGEDYATLTGTVTIPAGATSVAVTVDVVDDIVWNEGNETVDLAILSGNYMTGAQNSDTVVIADDELSSDWPRRMRITFPGYDRDARLTNFPAVIVLDEGLPSFHYADFGFPADGADLRFLDETETVSLNYEVEEWDTNASSYIWVQVPVLESNTVLWAYWGNTNTTAPDCRTNGAVWDSTFHAVWHLGRTNGSPDARDSTISNSDGNPVAVVTNEGQVGYGQYFDETNAYIGLPEIICPNEITISTWAKSTDTTGNLFIWHWSGTCNRMFSMGAAGTLSFSGYEKDWSAPYGVGVESVGTTTTFNDGEWHHVSVVWYAADWAVLYIDAEVEGQGVFRHNIAYPPSPWPSIANWYNGGATEERYEGVLDEMQFSRVPRTTDWIWACYMNQGSNDTFNLCEVLTETPQTITDPVGDVTTSSASLNGTLHAAGGLPPRVFVFWGSSDGGTNASAWEYTNAFGVHVGGTPAAYATNVSGLTSDKFYYYRYAATNGYGFAWAASSETFFTGELTVEATTNTASESGGDGMFTISRSGISTNIEMTVPIQIGGSADPGIDYTIDPDISIVVFAVGISSTTFKVHAKEDMTAEADESVTLTILPGSYAIAAPASATVTIGESDPTHWLHRTKITLPGYVGAGAVNDFPALVVLNTNTPGFHYSEVPDPAAANLRFRSGNQSEVFAYEVEEWNTNGKSYVWIRVSQVQGTNTTIWAYWENPDRTDQPDCTTNGAVWDGSFDIVAHLDHTNGVEDLRDSSGYNRHGSVETTSNELGIISYGQGADGGSIWFDNPMWRPNTMTFSTWVKINAGANCDIFHCYGFTASGGKDIRCTAQGDGIITGYERWAVGFGGSLGESGAHWSGNVTTSADEWHHVAIQKESSSQQATIDIYVDGELDTRMGPIYEGWLNVPVGTVGPSWQAGTYNGVLDEWRVANVLRSADWIKACYMNQGSVDSFVVWTPMVKNYPGPLLTSQTNVTLRGSVQWVDDAPSTVFICWGTSDGGRSTGAWEHVENMGVQGVGEFTLDVDILQDTVYYYRCFATNDFRQFTADETVMFVSGEITLLTTDNAADEEGPDSATFEVVRDIACTSVTLYVDYSIAGDAENGVDYEPLSGTAVLPAGETSVTVTVMPIDDDMFGEGVEDVQLAILPVNYFIGTPGTGTAFIRDNDREYEWRKWMRIGFEYDRDGLTNFPALVVFGTNRLGFSYSDFRDGAADLRFLNAAQTDLLDYEIELWNTNGDSFLWVEVPVLSANSYIWACWGNEGKTNPSAYPEGAWSEGYAGVWHLDEAAVDETNTAVHYDSTAYGNDGSQAFNASAVGLAAGAQAFDGDNDCINCGNGASLGLQGDMTLSIWLSPAMPTNEMGLISKWGNSWRWGLGHDSTNGVLTNSVYFDEWHLADAPVSTGRWNYLAVVYDADADRFDFYRDGNPDGSVAESSGRGTGGNLTIGQMGGDAGWFNGVLDEARVSGEARSSNWIWACWMTMASNDAFTAYDPVVNWGGSIIIVK